MYSKTTWQDGQNQYDIKTQADEVLETDIKLVYKGAGGTPVTATNMNNIETGIEATEKKMYGIMRKIRMKGMV